MKNQKQQEQNQEPKGTALVALFLICVIFIIGRIGWGLGYQHANSQAKSFPEEGVYFYSKPDQPREDDLHFGMGGLQVFREGNWYWADIVPSEIAAD
jgi:hypothetical protein